MDDGPSCMTRNAVSSSRTSFNAKQSQQQKPSIIRYVVAIPADDELALTTGHVPCCPKPSDSISTRATVMDHKLPDKKKLSLQTLLAKIEDVLQHGSKDDPPAYTLILGAGASS